MKLVLWISAACALPFFLNSCTNTVGGNGNDGMTQQPGIGPFDSHGTYHEEWADNPSQWRKPGNASSRITKTEDVPQIAQNEQPPLNSVPLASASVKTSTPKPTISESKVSSTRSEAVVVKTRPLSKAETEAAKTRSKAKSEPEVAKSKSKAKSEPEVVKAKTKAKSEPEVTKSKSKATVAKTKSSHYVVKKGDSLSSIASRNSTSVSALKRENGISGATIRPGETLTIPKK
ncbi:MAG: LysM peptidoglycan-binding domain-containing protein [Luteolibacter sp.]